MEHFKKYLNRGRDLNGLSMENPQLYHWWYYNVKNDETPMYGSKSKKDAVQVPIEDVEEETYELPESFDYEVKNESSAFGKFGKNQDFEHDYQQFSLSLSSTF